MLTIYKRKNILHSSWTCGRIAFLKIPRKQVCFKYCIGYGYLTRFHSRNIPVRLYVIIMSSTRFRVNLQSIDKAISSASMSTSSVQNRRDI